ncbi:unnamed protein product [Linum tenue]|uniref:Uncharacterized protein n=1 Tax=Linum tenue TaxID=586396 RepID=A0AAV0P4R9_9ROSI|nr:unnamed protein product [Linum tenue]
MGNRNGEFGSGEAEDQGFGGLEKWILVGGGGGDFHCVHFVVCYYDENAADDRVPPGEEALQRIGDVSGFRNRLAPSPLHRATKDVVVVHGAQIQPNRSIAKSNKNKLDGWKDFFISYLIATVSSFVKNWSKI